MPEVTPLRHADACERCGLLPVRVAQCAVEYQRRSVPLQPRSPNADGYFLALDKEQKVTFQWNSMYCGCLTHIIAPFSCLTSEASITGHMATRPISRQKKVSWGHSGQWKAKTGTGRMRSVSWDQSACTPCDQSCLGLRGYIRAPRAPMDGSKVTLATQKV